MARRSLTSRRDPDLDQAERIDTLLARVSPPSAGPRILDDDREEPWVPAAAGLDDEEPEAPARDRAPARVRLPSALQGATTRPGLWAVIGMAVVVLVAAAVFGVRVLRAQADAAPVPISATSAPRAASTPSATGSRGSGERPSEGSSRPTGAAGASGAPVAASAGAGAGATTVVVQVAGQVVRPGVVTLPAGSRVNDAVAKCGGTRPKADLTSVNLARPLVDGEQIVVTAVGAPAAARPSTSASAGAAPGGSRGPGGSGAAHGSGTASSSSPVDLNTADEATLDALPGVGPVMAKRIVEWRTQHGRFSSVDELGEISGVGEKTLARLTPLVKV